MPAEEFVIDFISNPIGKRQLYILSITDLNIHIIDELHEHDFENKVISFISNPSKKICFDIKKILNSLNIKNVESIYDISLLFKSNNLYSLINSFLKEEDQIAEYEKHNKKILAAAKASATVGLKNYSLNDVTQKKFIFNFHKMRCIAMMLLFKKTNFSLIEYENYTLRLLNIYNDIENNKIFINRNVLNSTMTLEIGNRRFIKDVKKHIDENDYIKTSFNVIGTKTGRILSEKGYLNCMTIPNSEVRNIFTSRFDDGKIVSFDFNALDYRCIIASLNCELKSEYDNCDDFHSRTVELILNEKSNDIRRKIIKEATYIVLYGGSRKVLYDIGLSEKKANILYDKIHKLMKPIFEFSNVLSKAAVKEGYIEIFNFKRIPIKEEDRRNANYLLSLYAQACSAKVFSDAIISAHSNFCNTSSKELFTVYDELVVDMHPNEENLIDSIVCSMEHASLKTFKNKFKVNVDIGNSYGELSARKF